MKLSCTLEHRIRQRQMLACYVCGRDIEDGKQKDRTLWASVFGWKKFSICPSCYREISDCQETRRKIAEYLRLHYNIKVTYNLIGDIVDIHIIDESYKKGE